MIKLIQCLLLGLSVAMYAITGSKISVYAAAACGLFAIITAKMESK